IGRSACSSRVALQTAPTLAHRSRPGKRCISRPPLPSRLRTTWNASLGGEPGEQHGVSDARLASEVHDRELAGAEEPGKRLRAHAQPLPRFVEGNQLWRRGEFQREFLLLD